MDGTMQRPFSQEVAEVRWEQESLSHRMDLRFTLEHLMMGH
jgi:hypothetical protein